MSLDDIIKRNQRYATADADDIKHRILAMAIVVGVIIAIIALIALL